MSTSTEINQKREADKVEQSIEIDEHFAWTAATVKTQKVFEDDDGMLWATAPSR